MLNRCDRTTDNMDKKWKNFVFGLLQKLFDWKTGTVPETLAQHKLKDKLNATQTLPSLLINKCGSRSNVTASTKPLNVTRTTWRTPGLSNCDKQTWNFALENLFGPFNVGKINQFLTCFTGNVHGVGPPPRNGNRLFLAWHNCNGGTTTNATFGLGTTRLESSTRTNNGAVQHIMNHTAPNGIKQGK